MNTIKLTSNLERIKNCFKNTFKTCEMVIKLSKFKVSDFDFHSVM